MTTITSAITLLLILIAAPAYADGGGPILLLVSFFLFVVGQVWIVLSELIYMKLLHWRERTEAVLKIVVSMNLISMLIGGLALPFMLALVGLAGVFMMEKPSLRALGGYIFAAGTWIGGDNSPHPTLALISAVVGFVGTYFITVYVEWWYLKRQTQKGLFPHTSLMHCYCINATSYSGLVALMCVGYFAT